MYKMSLYLTSDEISNTSSFDGDLGNSRTNFVNNILPDFFQDTPFNIALKEVYFDRNFPSLAYSNCPHIITIVNPSKDNINDFPKYFQDIEAFKLLFDTQRGNIIFAPLRVYVGDLNTLEECRVKYEIHPRLNYAFCIVTLKDITFKSVDPVL